MKNNWIWCLLAALALGSLTVAQAQQTGGENEKAVLTLEYQRLQADKTNDADMVASILADKYISTGPT